MILSETQDAVRAAVRSFAQDRIRPNSAAFEAAKGYPAALFEELAGLGLLGMTAPDEVGGAAADYASYALALMEIAAGSDASAIRTRAEKVDGGYRLNGAKQFITSGSIADLRGHVRYPTDGHRPRALEPI